MRYTNNEIQENMLKRHKKPLSIVNKTEPAKKRPNEPTKKATKNILITKPLNLKFHRKKISLQKLYFYLSKNVKINDKRIFS